MSKSVQQKISLLALLVCLMFTGWPCACFASSEEKVILTTHNLYPYGSYTTDGQTPLIADENFQGVAVDRVRCVFKKMATPLEIRVVPWRRAQLLVKRGDANGFFAASQNDSRDEFAEKTMILADQQWNWYLLKDNPLSPREHNFKGEASVGGFVGANMLKWMKDQNYNVTATPNDTEGLLKILLARRVDAVMANNYVMQELLQNYGVEDQVKVYLNIDKPLFVYFSKEFLNSRPMFIDRFNHFIPECSQ